MNLHLKPFSLRQLLVKIAAYIAMFYLLIIVVSISVTSYIFFNLDAYRERIEKTVYKHTGYKLQVGFIQTKLTNLYLPEVLIKNVSLINPINSKQSMHIATLDFVFSYSSIWNLEPIFKRILVDGTTINLEYDPSGNIFVNGININNPDKQTLENTKNNPIDVEKWILKQHNITFDHINLTYLDLKNNLPEVTLNNVKLSLDKFLWHKHRLSLDIYGKSYQNSVEGELIWDGDKFEDFQQWPEAKLKIKSLNGNDSIISTIQQYLPGVSTVNEFNATTALEANMKKGVLQYLYANFDINNFQVALADANLVNFPKLGGSVKIQLLNKQYYSIDAQKLVIITSAGALFNNASITGGYNLGNSGSIELSNTNLIAMNNLLSLFSMTDGINIEGTIKIVKFNWDGELLKPTKFQIYAAFDDISLRSARPEYPSLSHVSGDITIHKDSGHLNLNLKNSILNYDKVFLIPYIFKSLTSQIDWQIATNNQLIVTLHKTQLETKDFKAVAEGSYHTEPDDPDSIGYLTLRAHVEKVATSKVGDYLPKSIPMSVHEWLNMALIGGYGSNADLDLHGPLNDFPYQDGGGLFYITADVQNARLRYVKDWPTLDNIQGKFILRNTNITIKANSALIQNNYLDPTIVIIPDYSSDAVYLTAEGKAHGKTANFMEYLRNTPINQVIGRIPEKLTTSGDGKISIYLKVPFKDPKETEVKGIYTFFNNDLKFAMPIPLLSNVDGDLEFSHKGVNIRGLKARAFNSGLTLEAVTDKNGKINFTAISPNLDYQGLSQFYLNPVSGLFNGSAPTKINFIISKHGIETLAASSNLRGVRCLAASPLNKDPATISPMNFAMVPNALGGYLLTFNYASELKGQVVLNKNSETDSIKLALGNGTPYLIDPDLNSAMTINALNESFDIEAWLGTIKKITTAINKEKLANKESANLVVNGSIINGTTKAANKIIFPIQIVLNSNNIKFGHVAWGAGVANILVEMNKAYFNVYTPIISGAGSYSYAKDKLKLNLDKYMLFRQAHKDKVESSSKISFVNGSSIVSNEKIPQIDLTISNLFYQNHNLGKLTANVHQAMNNVYLESGVLTSNDLSMTFSGTNFCFGCGRDASYVDLQFNSKINDAGNVVFSLDLGRVLDKGSGDVSGALQWNGGFQDFSILQTVGSVNASLSSGKFLQVNPGVLGGLLSIINLQGVFEVGSMDMQELFKKGFFFNQLDVNADILTSQVELKRIYMSGPMAKVNSAGTVNFANNSVDASVSITPKLGVVVAVTAGVATLNPLIGIGVYLGELLFGDPQNKLFTFGYHISGNLSKPKIQRTKVREQFVSNVNSTIGNSNGVTH